MSAPAALLIGTTIHDERVEVARLRYGYAVLLDGRRHSRYLGTEAAGVELARSFVPAHRSAEVAR
jgi:hypothetical protein